MPFDPFATLGLPRGYAVDRAAVQRAYLTQAARWHPDRFSDPIARRDAEQRSAEINAARVALEDDEQRASALLALLGGPGKSDDKSLPDGFLMEILDVRSELEEAMQSGDATQKASVQKWAEQQRAQYRDRVAALFDQAGEKLDDESLTAIRHELNAWRYIERLIEQIEPSPSS